MPRPDEFECFDRRLCTFQVAHTVKSRTSSVKKKAGTTLKWSHSSPDAESLANAGFFYDPSASSPDNCQCFMCGINLDGWEGEDDPVAEHWSIKADCPWAIVCYVKQQFQSEDNAICQEDPMSNVYVDARTATFRHAWPHEDKKGWKCKVAKMVAAGWHFDPSLEDDDGVVCSYCNLSLGGWERKDDPRIVHLERMPGCLFFRLDAIHKQTRQVSIKSRTSKASRASSQSTASFRLNNITLADLNATYMSRDSNGDDSGSAATSMVIKPARTRKKISTVQKNTVKGRLQKATALEGSLIYEDGATQNLSEPESKSEPKPEPAPEPVAPVRQTRRQASRQISGMTEPSAIGAGSKPKRTNLKEAAVVDSAILEPPKLTRGKKRTSSGTKKDGSIDFQTNPLPNAYSDKHTSHQLAKTVAMTPDLTSGIASAQRLDCSIAVLDEAAQILEDPEVKRAKTGTRHSSARVPLQDIPVQEVQEVQMSDDFSLLQSDMLLDASASTPKQTPEASEGEGSTAPPSPTPAKHQVSSATRRVSTRSLQATPRPAVGTGAASVKKPATPDLSPQFSDVENQPPSARPQVQGSLTLNPMSPMRTPSQSTPRHQKRNLQSPFKHHFSRLHTDFPWSPSDLEAVFFSVSPQKRFLSADKKGFLPSLAGSGQDEGVSMDDFLDKKSLAHAVAAVRANMTDDERAMNVQQWLSFTADKGAEILHAKCEEMVTLFERQGAKGMRALEGIQIS